MRKPKPLRDRLTKPILEKLRLRKITNAEAAAHFNVSETYLSRVVASLQEKVPGPTMESREAASKLFQARRMTRELLAKQVKRGELDVTSAAERANCSVRTMARYVAAYVPPRRAARGTSSKKVA